jgi:DNA-binding NarL/FixJ family response regulator
LENLCGNRLCVNPDHWRIAAAVVEGGVVFVSPKRERPIGKIEARRLEIERLWRAGKMITDIADELGISRVTVWRAIKGLRE